MTYAMEYAHAIILLAPVLAYVLWTVWAQERTAEHDTKLKNPFMMRKDVRLAIALAWTALVVILDRWRGNWWRGEWWDINFIAFEDSIVGMAVGGTPSAIIMLVFVL